MSKSVVAFTVGPVQGFIEEARRTRDLWMGSQILVALIRGAARAAVAAGADLIYPKSAEVESLPNRFVAEVEPARALDTMRACETAVDQVWRRICDSARSELAELAAPSDYWNQTWLRQTKRHIETYWSIADPISDDESYQSRYQRATQALGARKRTRNFDQSEETGLKDALSGSRAAMSNSDTAESQTEYWTEIAQHLKLQERPTLLRANGKECLDAIGSVKRFSKALPIGLGFPSVSTIAAADFLRRVKTSSAKAMATLASYMGRLDNLRDQDGYRLYRPALRMPFAGLADWDYDGDLLFTDTLTSAVFLSDYGLNVPDQGLAVIRSALSDVHRNVGATPSTYYAILMMDGDRMGSTVASLNTELEHGALAESLTGFAKKAKSIVETEYAGRLVYAGGDDVVALLPLVDALPASIALHEAFQTAVGSATTISAGIAIAHHRSPLSITLRAAREAEAAAKERFGRDAICMRILKRSGEHMLLGAKWAFGDGLSLITRLAGVFHSDASQASRLATKFAYDAYSESGAFAEWPEQTASQRAYQSRIRYLARRHNQSLTQTEIDAIADGVATFATELASTEAAALWLLAARFVATGGAE